MSRSILAVLTLCLLTFSSRASAAERSAAPPAQQPPAVGWPQILRDSAHSSVSPDQKLSASTASTMGIHWMSAMRSVDVGSPVSAYNATLHRTVVYVGDERGDVLALNEADGTTLWATSVGNGNSERASPLVAPDGSVWAATTYIPKISKLDGATGNALCSLSVPLHINSSLMLATPPGGVPTIYTGTNHNPSTSGPEIAIRESDCSEIWSFEKWLTLSGIWATPAFGVDANGNGRVYVGTADPDSTLYAVDALTGKGIWHYSALNPPDGIYDIGAAATVSAPGNNGFADGVVYFPSKYGVMYALDMTNGKVIWQYNFNKAAGLREGGRSAAALYKKSLVYGVADGAEAVDATTGALLWHYKDPARQEVLSSPAITGPTGNEIVAFGDVTGLFTVLRLSDGKPLYTYQTGNYITSSPAIINGHIIIASTDGFLYDFTTGGLNVAPPGTAIASPATGTKVQNPGGTVTVSGTATDSTGGGGVTDVQLAVQMGGPTGPFYDAETATWVSGAVNNFVAVATPQQRQSTWSFSLPVPTAGSTYQVTVNTVDASGQADRVGAQTSFVVLPAKGSPHLTLSMALVPPATSFTAYGGAFAPNETVDFVLQNSVVGHGIAGANGFVPKLTINVPATAAFGESSLTATGETSHKATSAAVDITNVWSQLSYSAIHTAAEPNDPILANTLQSTNKGYLSRAWMFASGAPIDASPAIVGGSAFVANTAGAISAVDTASGFPFWTYTITSGAAIHGSPAVGNGAVVVGADDGSLYRVGSASGLLLGSAPLDGIPTASALISGILYVGTDNGTVYAINETTGTTLWSTAIGAAIHQPPSVDTTRGVVIVGDDAGNVTTLNLATGVKTAQITTGGASVTVPPGINAGKILIGASDGIVRAFDETTGALDWQYSVNAPIHALATSGNQVFVGSDAGNLTQLSLSAGSPIFVVPNFGSAVVGITHSTGVTLAETAKGNFDALKDEQGGRIQYTYATGGGLSTEPAVVDGTVYVGAEDGGLYTFTNHGQAPQGAIEHQFLLQVRKTAPAPARWSHSSSARRATIATRAFQPHGQRDFAMHIDRPGPSLKATPASVLVAPNAAVRTYVLGWSPVAVRAEAYIARVGAVTGSVAGTFADTAPYPRILDDAAVQREVARAIATHGWRASPGTRFLVVTAGAPVSSVPYCGYHSAFHLGGALTAPAIYGVVPAATTDGCTSFATSVGHEWNQLEADPYARAR